MKKMWLILSLVVFLLGFVGCEKDSNEPGKVGLIDKPTKIFEVLKGEWIWYSYYTKDPASEYDGHHQPKHTSIIHILSQNADSSINYKVYTNDIVCSSDSVTFYKEGTFKTGVSFYKGEEIATISSNVTSQIEEPYDHLYCDIKGSWGNDTVNDLDFIVIDANSSSSIAYNYSRMAAPITVTPFDSLKGDWKWVKTSGGFAGKITDAEPATIQILSQNADSSVNFKSFTNGTLLKEGTFMNKIASINCGVYRIRVFDQNITSHDDISTFSQLWYQLRNDTLIFEDWDGTDSFVYYYAKVK